MALVGIDLGGTQLRVAIADDRGRLRTVVRRPTEAARGRRHVIGRIVAAVADALAEDGTPASRVRALGIGLPGPVDPSAPAAIAVVSKCSPAARVSHARRASWARRPQKARSTA